ncbi:dipeptide epimerase [Sulfurimonas sp. NW9]|uniref:dipeptide epimerase n=1 Tax=Sulfurimonas sp. NW9 TaxID=2922728 RepID=UPI003DA848DB
MKIQKIERQIKKRALKTPFVTALRRVENVEFIRLRITCDNGLYAYGEAPATKAVTGEDLQSIANAIGGLQDALLGLTPGEALHVIHGSTMGSSAKAALDMAVVSLLAQQNNQTLLQYLGTKDFSPIFTDITVSLNDADIMLSDAKKAFDNGFHILKVKLGSDLEHAVAVTKMITETLVDAEVLIDANQAWNLEQSLYYVEAVAGLHVSLIEQPVVADDLQSLKTITQKSTVPILADEAVFTLEDVKKVYEEGCANMINVKLMKCGGVSRAQEILEYARSNNIECMLGSMLEGPVSIHAALCLAFAYRDVVKYVDLDSPLLYKDTPEILGEFGIIRNTIQSLAGSNIYKG